MPPSIVPPSIVHILLESAERLPDKPALLYRRAGRYEPISYRQLVDRVEDLTHGLVALGIVPGDRVGILSYNRPEWPMADFAILALRAVTVPIYHTLPASQIAYILRDAGVKALFVEDRAQLAKVEEVRAGCPDLAHVVMFSPASTAVPVTPFEALLERGREHRRLDQRFFQHSVEAIDPMALCSLVYTSGTTGEPKGVMLNHRGFVRDVVSSEQVFRLRPEDVFLSFLPLSHLYERVGGHWCPLYRGCTIAYAEDISTVARDLQIVRPTVMVSVPRVYEKLREKVQARAESGSHLTRALFHQAMKDGVRYHELKLEGRRDRWLSARHWLADRLVLRRVRQVLGGHLRFPIAGGAPLSVHTLRFFKALGLDMVEGYGMTETHLIVTLTQGGKTRPGSCGRPIPGVEVSLAPDGEVLVRGETVMSGYYHKPQQTREAIDADGWLHTGDIGRFDGDGYLYITDRKKNLIITAGGKNVAPAPIENALKASQFIEEVCVVGDARKFIAAVIVPVYEEADQWAAAQGLGALDRPALAACPALQERIMEDIRRLQSEFAGFEQVKKCVLLPEPFSVERGELTPTLKVKRRVIEQRYRSEIDALYSGQGRGSGV